MYSSCRGIDLSTFIPALGTFEMAAFKILPSISKISTRINAIVYHQLSLQEAYNNLKEANKYGREIQEYILNEANSSVKSIKNSVCQ